MSNNLWIPKAVGNPLRPVYNRARRRLMLWAKAQPRGVLGYAEATSSQTGIEGSTTDLTGLTTTVEVGTDRLIRVTGWGTFRSASSPDERVRMRIRRGGNTITYTNSHDLPTADNEGVELVPIALQGNLTAGSYTFKLTAQRIAGATPVELNANTLQPAFILVEDIGAA